MLDYCSISTISTISTITTNTTYYVHSTLSTPDDQHYRLLQILNSTINARLDSTRLSQSPSTFHTIHTYSTYPLYTCRLYTHHHPALNLTTEPCHATPTLESHRPASPSQAKPSKSSPRQILLPLHPPHDVTSH